MTATIGGGTYSSDLQQMHDALPADGGVILLGRGQTYTLGSRLQITKDNVTIQGEGADNTTIVRNFTGSNQLISVTGANFKLADVAIDANGNQGTGSVLLLMDIGARLERVAFQNYPYIALDIENLVDGLRVIDCMFTGMNGAEAVGNYGVWGLTAHVKRDVVFSGCRFINNQIGGIFLSKEAGVRVESCFFKNNNFAGGGQVTTEALLTSEPTIVTGNVFDCSDAAGISAVEANGADGGYAIITNNMIYHGGTNGWGIVLQGGRSYVVTDNILIEPGAAGIMAYKGADTKVRNFTIENNRVVDGGAYGIHIQADAEDYTIVNNDLTGCASGAILDSSLHAGRVVYGNKPVGTDDGILRVKTLAIDTAVIPDATAGADLGSTANQFFNLFLSEGGKIDWDNGDATLTQVGNMLTLAGADLTLPNLVATGVTVGGTAVTVSGHAHADHANRTRAIYVTCGDLGTITDGTPSLLVQGSNSRYRAWAFDATTQEGVIGELYLPEDYVSAAVTVKIHWTNLGAGAGNVQWQVALKHVADAANLNTTGFTTASDVIAAPAQDVLKISTSTISYTPVAGSHIACRVRREAASGSDTLANDAGLLAIEIEYPADM